MSDLLFLNLKPIEDMILGSPWYLQGIKFEMVY